MNSLSLMIVNRFTKFIFLGLIFSAAFFVQVTVKAWELDLSRRSKDIRKAEGPRDSLSAASTEKPKKWVESVADGVAGAMDPTQEIVILHTENGFVPSTIRLKKGQNYRFHVVNVNDKEKNASFILDAFGEHHATYFGQEKSFQVSPRQEGIFSFLCPETAKQGRVVIVGESPERRTASSP